MLVVLTTRSSGFDRYEVPANLTVVDAVEKLAGRHEHGWRDQLHPLALDLIAAERRIEATCGYVSAWAVSVLNHEGFEARMVSTLTLDEWDDVNNGHVLVEAKVDGVWVVFDIDRDVWFWRDGKPLSFIEYVDAVAEQDYEIRPLSGDPTRTEAVLRRDDRRLIQVPLIHEDGMWWFHSTDPERVASYEATYEPLTEATWQDRFYG